MSKRSNKVSTRMRYKTHPALAALAGVGGAVGIYGLYKLYERQYGKKVADDLIGPQIDINWFNKTLEEKDRLLKECNRRLGITRGLLKNERLRQKDVELGDMFNDIDYQTKNKLAKIEAERIRQFKYLTHMPITKPIDTSGDDWDTDHASFGRKKYKTCKRKSRKRKSRKRKSRKY